MLRSKRAILLVAALVFASFALTACGGAKVDTDTLVVAQGADATTLDPHGGNDQPSARVMRQIYDTLMGLDENMEIYPLLAESYEQIDPLTWEFKLKEGVKFHDGNEMTADDVVFSIERHLKSPEVSHILGLVDKIEKIDDYNVKITTKEPFAALLRHLSHASTAILSKASVEKSGQDYGQHPVGAGAYKFIDWATGDSITLERFEDYHGELAKTKNIVFKAVSEASGRTVGLETGEISIAYDIDPVDIGTVKADDSLEYLSEPSLSIDYIGMNNLKKPFDDVRVRRAMNYAINVPEILDTILEGDGELAASPLQSAVFGATKDVDVYEYDPEKAKALLAEAGYPDGQGFPSVVLLYNPEKGHGTVMQAVQDMWKTNLGIDVQLQSQEWKVFIATRNEKNYEIARDGWGADYVDPMTFLDMLQTTSGQNNSGYSNPEYDKIIDEAKAEQDPSKRFELFRQAEDILMEDMPVIPLYYDTQPMGVKNYIKDLNVSPLGFIYFDKAYIEGK